MTDSTRRDFLKSASVGGAGFLLARNSLETHAADTIDGNHRSDANSPPGLCSGASTEAAHLQSRQTERHLGKAHAFPLGK